MDDLKSLLAKKQRECKEAQNVVTERQRECKVLREALGYFEINRGIKRQLDFDSDSSEYDIEEIGNPSYASASMPDGTIVGPVTRTKKRAIEPTSPIINAENVHSDYYEKEEERASVNTPDDIITGPVTRNKKKEVQAVTENEDGIGTICETVDGKAVKLREGEWGWTYRTDQLPGKYKFSESLKQHLSLKESDVFISDYDFVNLDVNDPMVKRVDSKEVSSFFRMDLLFFCDASRLVNVDPRLLRSPNRMPFLETLEYIRDVFDVRPFFGGPKNHLTSQAIVNVIAQEGTTLDVKRAQEPVETGECDVCGCSPRRLSSVVTLNGVTYKLGYVCKKRIEILYELCGSWEQDPGYVYGFYLQDAIHSLTQLNQMNSNPGRFLVK